MVIEVSQEMISVGSTPSEPVSESIQVINEFKEFNTSLIKYMRDSYLSPASPDNGLTYHIVSVFGSQSTGKSTLLNNLFGTKFDVMDEVSRQQTTKGIWLAHATHVASAVEGGSSSNSTNIYVMDVEGTDGRERGEDQDFERKSALFALSTSEVLLINIWEYQVGLYQGANLGLLRTVFEVNLALFSQERTKSLILFVIRDHVGNTPLENLAGTLTADLEKIWDQLSKPAGAETLKLNDFFDLKFAALSHKVLQPEAFREDVAKLGDRFTGSELFKPEYHRGVPIDGWTVYSEQIWEQIETNKDLDLPTQRIAAARQRCDEISSECYASFLAEFKSIDPVVLSGKDLSEKLKAIRSTALSSYNVSAVRYPNVAYLERQASLKEKLDQNIKDILSSEIRGASKLVSQKFTNDIEAAKKSRSSEPYADVVQSLLQSALSEFETAAGVYSIVDDEDVHIVSYSSELTELTADLGKAASEAVFRQRQQEILSRTSKSFQAKMKKTISSLIRSPTSSTWDLVIEAFEDTAKSLLAPYRTESGYDFGLGTSEETTSGLYMQIRKQFWIKFRDLLHILVTEDSVSWILRNKFEDLFRFDKEGVPRIWRNASQVDEEFKKARTITFSLLPVLADAVLSDGTEIHPDVDIAHDVEVTNSEENPHIISHLLGSEEQQNVMDRLKKEINAIYVETKRATIQSAAHIPFYIYVVILVLGWNEFMAVLRNPLLCTLIILSGGGFYVCYQLQMLGPILSVATAMFEETKVVIKAKLKELLLEPEAAAVPAPEIIELDDLSELKKD
ncbi:unnamed protein product [Kuraishia capsulata CBS 1993]|uniref:GB1/RHD3-type G domain-containing protein n=1 Tax=Kuraishia capsulata CBS 1993 TaxID=1382522 RepID=W6MJ77_9ASCO|nr:uncharacterized protein KUCA_T00002272001 [Kuraishia capsulata CBS 1993]CDK26301.1 unnamed protein product [Kuraishia capsulata CBS 1993]